MMKSRFSLCAMAMLCFAVRISAQTTQWTGATGNWSTAGNWSNGVPNSADTVVFNSPATASVDQAFVVNSIQFNGGSQNITDGGGSLNVSGLISYSGGTGVSIEAPIGGTGDLWLNGGTGTLTLNPTFSGANTYSGSTQVFAGGTLADGKADSFSDNSILYVGGSPHGAVDVNFNESVAALGDIGGGPGYVNLAPSATLFINGGFTSEFTGFIQGSGNLEKDGNSTQILGGANTYTGTTTIGFGATLQLGDGSAQGTLTGTSSINGAGSIVFWEPPASTTTISAPIIGSLGVVSNGSGTTELTGLNTYSGGTTLLGGILQAGSTNAFGTSTQSMVISGGTLDLNGYNISLPSVQMGPSGSINLNGATLTLTNTSGSNTIAGSIFGSGALVESEYQFDVTSNTNTYTGGTTIVAGTFIANNSSSSAYATGMGGVITIDSGAALLIGQANANGYINPAATIFNSGALQFFRSDGTIGSPVVIANNILGTGGVDQNGAGVTELTGNNSYSGPTSVFNGTLQAGSSTAFGGGSGKSAVSFPNAGTLALNGFNNTVGSIDGTTTSGGIDLGANTLTLNDTSANTVFYATIAGAGGSMIFGENSIILEGNNTYSGGTTIVYGTVLLANPTGYGLGTGAVTISAGGTLDVGVSTLGAVSPAPITNNGQLNFNGSVQGTIPSVISGTGSVTVNGGGVILTGANTYSGVTNLAAGTTVLDNPTGSATGTSDVGIFNGATLQIGNADANGSLSPGALINNNGQLYLDRSGASTFDANISGTGSVELINNGSVTLTGTNTYSGPTVILTSGSLYAGSSNAFGNGSSDLTIINGGLLIANSHNLTFNSLSGDLSGQIQLGSATLTTGTAMDDGFGGTISGTGGLTVIGNGTQTLTGNNTYTGPTNIGAGSTLTIGNGTSGASITSDVSGLGTLQFYEASNITYANAFSGASLTVTQLGSGITTLTGDNSAFTGTFDVFGGTLKAGSPTAFGNGGASVIMSGGSLDLGNTTQVLNQLEAYNTTDTINIGSDSLQLQGSADNTVAASLVGTGVLSLNGAGNTYLEGDNSSFTGTFYVLNGGLLSAAPNALGNGGASLFINGNASLDLDGTDQSLSQITSSGGTTQIGLDDGSLTLTGNGTNMIWGDVTGNGGLILNGTGTTLLRGTNSYSGPTTINAGFLTDQAPNSFSPNSTIIVNNTAGLIVSNSEIVGAIQNGGAGGTVYLATSATLTSMGLDYVGDFQGAISGGGTFSVGGGVQGLSGNNTYTGGTFVTGGGELFVGSNTALGTGTVTFDNGTEFSPDADVTLSNNIVLENNVDLDNDDGANFDMTLNGTISGNGGFEWCTPGTLTLTGANTFTGGVDMREGNLVLGNNTAAGNGGTITLDYNTSLNVMSGVTVTNPINFTGNAILTGSGTIASPVVAGSFTTIAGLASPGNGPGTLTFSNGLTLASGSQIYFGINDATGAPGTGFSLISATGGLNLTAAPGMIALDIFSIDSMGNLAPALNFNSATPYSWTFASSTTAISGFNANQFQIFDGSFQNSIGVGYFTVSESGNNLLLNFSPVPEPSTWCLIGAGVLVIVPLALRRRRAARTA